jgi:hypothetical protein
MENEFNRAERLTALRPRIPVIIEENSVSAAERFQNTTLRQICKLQHDLLKQVFANYIVKRKNAYFKLGDQQRLDYIKHSVDKDLRFRSLLVGIIAGHFTLEEWEVYLSDENEHRKRLTNLVVQRLQSMYLVF